MPELPSKKTLAVIVIVALLAGGLLFAALMGSQPEISLNGDAEVFLGYGEEYVELGASAVSPGLGIELDVSISGRVDTTVPGTTEIIYTAECSGRVGSAVRRVTVAEPEPAPTPAPPPEPELPRIELIGAELIEHSCGQFYSEPGVLALDADGNDVSDQVRTEGQVVEWRCGDYELSYSLELADGESIGVKRTVRVVPVGLPETAATENVIYLSFDDGPADYTLDVLDVLDANEVKASFFIIASQPDIELVKEIQARGHSIGIHCYRHDYRGIFSSVESFMEDFMQARRVLYEQTGEYPSISRFPGGSATARAYLNKQDKSSFDQVLQHLADMGVRWYDWNIQTESADYSTRDSVTHFTHGVPQHKIPISLQHDTLYFSYKALEQMIPWALNNGYSFAALNNTVPNT